MKTTTSLVEDLHDTAEEPIPQQHSAGPGLGTGMYYSMHEPVPGLQSSAHPLPAPLNVVEPFVASTSTPQEWTDTIGDLNTTSTSVWWPLVPNIPMGAAALSVVDYDPLCASYDGQLRYTME